MDKISASGLILVDESLLTLRHESGSQKIVFSDRTEIKSWKVDLCFVQFSINWPYYNSGHFRVVRQQEVRPWKESQMQFKGFDIRVIQGSNPGKVKIDNQESKVQKTSRNIKK